MTTLDQSSPLSDNAERANFGQANNRGLVVDMSNPDTRNFFQQADSRSSIVGKDGQMIFSNPFDEAQDLNTLLQSIERDLQTVLTDLNQLITDGAFSNTSPGSPPTDASSSTTSGVDIPPVSPGVDNTTTSGASNPGSGSDNSIATSSDSNSESSTAGDTNSTTVAATASESGPTTSKNGFDATPSWANDTAIDNNNGALVSPSYFAQTIPDNATYAPANLGNLKFPDNGFEYDEGQMIDERGMSPSQLETIPIYDANQDWTSNDSTGQYEGTIEVPIGTSVPRPITTFSNGTQVANNSVTTFIQPDGEEMSFAKTYIGTNSQVGDGGTVLIGAAVGQTGWFGNEVALTGSDVTDALNEGTAPSHALGIVVPTDVLSSVDDGVAGPSKYADSGYKSEYTSSNTNLRMGSLLAIPKDVTAQELGLQTPLGDALLATMQQYGTYIADTTPEQNTFSLESTLGVQNQIEQSGDSSEFNSDLDKLIAASQVVTSNPNASPHA